VISPTDTSAPSSPGPTDLVRPAAPVDSRADDDVLTLASFPWGARLLIMGAASLVNLLVALRTLWPVRHLDLFFDEMWRVDFIRSSNSVARMRLHDTPVPPGWVYLYKLPVAVLPHGPFALRLMALGFAGVFGGLATLIAMEIVARDLRCSSPSRRLVITMIAAGGVLVLPCLSVVSGVNEYFNQYSFECTWAATLLLFAIVAERSNRFTGPFGAMIVVTPLFTLVPVLLLPGMLGWLAWRRPHLRLRCMVAASGSAAFAAAMYAWLYRDVANNGVAAFWSEDSLFGAHRSAWKQVLFAASEIYTSVVDAAFPHRSGMLRVLLLVAFLASLSVGLTLARRAPIVLATISGGIAMTIMASAATDWPITPVRVNLPLFAFVWMLAGVGACRLLVWCVQERALLSVVPIALPLIILWPPTPSPDGPQPFARGLTQDLEFVAESGTSTNLVVSYHFMSHWYAHDRLVNERHGNRHFEVVREVRGDRTLYDDLSSVLAARWRPGEAVWCIMPYEMGSEASSEACRVDVPGLTKAIDVQGIRARIVGWMPSS
jgi:hypothetical protein